MSCCPYSIKPVNINTIDSTKLCNPCKVDFYRKRFEQLGNPVGGYTHIKAVWSVKIAELFRYIAPQHMNFLLSSINPPLWETCNLNENPITLANQIIGITEKFDVNVSFSLRNNLAKDPRVDSLCSKDIAYNLNAAKEACYYTRHELYKGVGNVMSNPFDKRFLRRLGNNLFSIKPLPLVIKDEIHDADQTVQWYRCENENEMIQNFIFDNIEMLRFKCAKARIEGVGNCQEHAIIAFLYLYDKRPPVRPIYMVKSLPDHVWVLIGGWFLPNVSIICDPYFDNVYLYTGELNSHHTSKGEHIIQFSIDANEQESGSFSKRYLQTQDLHKDCL